MKELKSRRKQRKCNYFKVSGIVLLAFLVLANAAGAAPAANITFITTGSSFSPIITVTGNPAIQWTFGDGSTSNSGSPTAYFGSAGTRVNTLIVTPWSAVTKINIGYDGSDGGVTPDPETIAYLKQQNVVAVSGLENVAPYLQVWASNSNPITALDFSNFKALNTVECFYCRSLDTIKLRNVPSLARLSLEESNLSYLDVSEAPVLADLRAGSQRSQTYTVNWGTTGANLWHICIRDNPQMTGTFPVGQFPLLKDFFNWNDNQNGTLHIISTNLRDVKSANNRYDAAIFSGCFPAGINAVVEIHNNNLTSLDISNDPGLLNLNASFNSLNQAAIDGILQTLDSYNTYNGNLDLTGNDAPSAIGIAHASNLTNRNWAVKISSESNPPIAPPIANFTSNITSGMIPLAVQFNDTSLNSPLTWFWYFGDGLNSTEQFPEHVYQVPGNYIVTLKVSNSNGSDFKTVVITALAQPVLPIANFSSNVTEGLVPLNVQFNDLSENMAERNWDFGDGSNSTEINPIHTYSVAGNYIVNLTVINVNRTASKTSTITVYKISSSSGGDSSGGSGDTTDNRRSGSNVNIGSPELNDNIENQEQSQAFIVSGYYIKFDFPKKTTPVMYIAFDAKRTPGKTTTTVETLYKRSILVSEPPADEIYKYLNIWVGNNGFITQENIENAVVCFKVEKSWIQEKNIKPSSITLNRYSKKWDQLPTSLLDGDDKYLYFRTKTPAFSPFVITGRIIANETQTQPANQSNTLSKTENAVKPALNTEVAVKINESTESNFEPASEKQQNPITSGEKSIETPGLDKLFKSVIFNLVLLACLLHIFTKK